MAKLSNKFKIFSQRARKASPQHFLYVLCVLKGKINIQGIHKSLRDIRPLRYSSRDGHAEGEHVNRGRDTPSFCPTLQVLDMLTSDGS